MNRSSETGAEKLLYDDFLEKGKRFCAYRDRCKYEVACKLKQSGASGQLLEKILEVLEDEGFIDEKRFSEAFARGKFEYNQWGRLRIKQELVYKNIPHGLIDAALEQIDQELYMQQLQKIAGKKLQSLKGLNAFTARGKTASYCIGKGFEPDLVWDIVNKMIY